MTGSAVAVPSRDPEQLRWLRIARFAAFCSLLFFLVVVIVVAFLDARKNGTQNLPLTLWTVPLWLPYLWMYLQMESRSTKRRKKGLALAVVYGAWALLIAAPCALESTGAALQGRSSEVGRVAFPLLSRCVGLPEHVPRSNSALVPLRPLGP